MSCFLPRVRMRRAASSESNYSHPAGTLWPANDNVKTLWEVVPLIGIPLDQFPNVSIEYFVNSRCLIPYTRFILHFLFSPITLSGHILASSLIDETRRLKCICGWKCNMCVEWDDQSWPIRGNMWKKHVNIPYMEWYWNTVCRLWGTYNYLEAFYRTHERI